MAHALMENRNGLLVGFRVSEASGTAERDAVPKLLDRAKERRQEAWTLSGERPWGAEAVLAPRVLLIRDNPKGHTSWPMVRWCLEHGVLPLWTPIAGSWLNLAESLQRILVRRALAGQPPEHTGEPMAWLAEAVVGWNADRTPFEWGGQRAARRRRARERHRLGGSGGYTRRPIPRCRRQAAHAHKGHRHDN